MRTLAVGLGVAAIVFAASGGQILFLPLLFLPFGLLSLRHWRQETRHLRTTQR